MESSAEDFATRVARCAAQRDCDVHRADGLHFAATAWSGDTRCRNRDVGVEARERAARHLDCGFVADGPVRCDRRGRDAEVARLPLVCVRDRATHEPRA